MVLEGGSEVPVVHFVLGVGDVHDVLQDVLHPDDLQTILEMGVLGDDPFQVADGEVQLRPPDGGLQGLGGAGRLGTFGQLVEVLVHLLVDLLGGTALGSLGGCLHGIADGHADFVDGLEVEVLLTQGLLRVVEDLDGLFDVLETLDHLVGVPELVDCLVGIGEQVTIDPGPGIEGAFPHLGGRLQGDVADPRDLVKGLGCFGEDLPADGFQFLPGFTHGKPSPGCPDGRHQVEQFTETEPRTPHDLAHAFTDQRGGGRQSDVLRAAGGNPELLGCGFSQCTTEH